MISDPDAPLTTQEFNSLSELSKEADPNAIPREHRQKLATLGLIKKVGVEVLVTSAGRLRLMRSR